jgi:hypothetical protein
MRKRVFSMKHVDSLIPIFKFKKTFKPAWMQSGLVRKRLILLKILVVDYVLKDLI